MAPCALGPFDMRGFFQTATNRLPTWTVKHAELLMCFAARQSRCVCFFGYLCALISGRGELIMGAFFWIIFRFDVWISLHADFWEGGILGAFLEFFSVRCLDIFTRDSGRGELSLHRFWEGRIMGAFLKFVFDSMFGFLYTLILGGGKYGRISGCFFDSVFGYLYILILGGGIMGAFLEFYSVQCWVSLHTDFGRGEFWAHFWSFFRFDVWIFLHTGFGRGEGIMCVFCEFSLSIRCLDICTH